MNNTSAFDVKKGAQSPYTGVMGAFFILSLFVCYSIYQYDILSHGGDEIPFNLTWLGISFSFARINRDYFDVLAMVLLGFQLMLCWEFTSRNFRFIVVIMSLLTLLSSWRVAHQKSVFQGLLTSMEWIFLFQFIATAVAFSVFLYLNKSTYNRNQFIWAVKTSFWRWLAGLICFYGLLIFTFSHPFYQDSFYENWRITCSYLFFLYLTLGFPYALLTNWLRKKTVEDRNDPNFVILLIFHGVYKLFKGRSKTLIIILKNRRVKQVLRDLLVKIFFIPLMITFLFQESGRISKHVIVLRQEWLNMQDWVNIFDAFYHFAYSGVFVMDVSLALIGYLSASRWLKNKSYSVDPTIFGWLVTLVCYPPFNDVMGHYLPYSHHFGTPFSFLQHQGLDIALKLLTILGLGLYVWSTMCFGLRFSNLTHRGIITRGPYAHIRHPAYIGKNMAWWAESISSFSSPLQFLFLMGWNVIYFMRAVTEERHLGQDENYRAYCESVKYRFLPGVY